MKEKGEKTGITEEDLLQRVRKSVLLIKGEINGNRTPGHSSTPVMRLLGKDQPVLIMLLDDL